MVWRKILRSFFYVLGIILAMVLIFALIAIGPVDRTPVEDFPAFKKTFENIDSVRNSFVAANGVSFTVGFSKVNLVPSFRTATAGYGNRRGKLFSYVRDSIFVRTLMVGNGVDTVAIVSADLLIIPPTVTRLLDSKLKSVSFTLERTYLGATHTHNSIGNWGEGAARFIYGPFEDSIATFIADQIVQSIVEARSDMKLSTLRYGAIPIPQVVENRLVKGGLEDNFFRVVEAVREDSIKILLTSFTAHATCLFSRDLMLSRDYPGSLVDSLEAQGYDFAMFISGPVGSHKPSSPDLGESCITWMASEISNAFMQARDSLRPVNGHELAMVTVPFPLSDPQVKILPDWKVRSWFFRSAFGEYSSYLTGLRLGDLILLGTPCDFSGEFSGSLDSVAMLLNQKTMVTSFNGGYVGYVTPRDRYETKHYETQLMNWYAPGTGELMRNSLIDMMQILSDSATFE